MRGIAMSCKVSGPMAIIAGGAASGERFDGSSRAAMGASAGDGRGVTSLEPKGVGPTIIASNCATVSPGEFPSLLILREESVYPFVSIGCNEAAANGCFPGLISGHLHSQVGSSLLRVIFQCFNLHANMSQLTTLCCLSPVSDHIS